VHILKEPKPKSVRPAAQAKDGLLGLANSIQKWKDFHRLPKLVPDWNNDGVVESPVSLTALMRLRVQEIQNTVPTIRNPYARQNARQSNRRRR